MQKRVYCSLPAESTSSSSGRKVSRIQRATSRVSAASFAAAACRLRSCCSTWKSLLAVVRLNGIVSTAALHGGDDESLPSYSTRATLEGLKMSALMERSRALGAPGDAVDECMDTPDPRASLIAMLEAWEGAAEEEEEGELLGEGGLRPWGGHGMDFDTDL